MNEPDNPLSPFFRKLRSRFRKIFGVKTIAVAGVRVTTDLRYIDRNARKQLYKGFYEAAELDMVSRNVKRGDRVLEIGAGVGVVSVACAARCGEGNLLSYEANSSLERTIRYNFKLNGMKPNLRLKAMSTEKGDAVFFVNEAYLSSSLYDRSNNEAKSTPADSIRDVIAEFDPAVIVIDAEGAEVDLLPATDLSRVQRIIAELHPHIVGEERIASLIDYLNQSGFVVRETRHKAYLFSR